MKKIEKWGTKSLEELANEYYNTIKSNVSDALDESLHQDYQEYSVFYQMLKNDLSQIIKSNPIDIQKIILSYENELISISVQRISNKLEILYIKMEAYAKKYYEAINRIYSLYLKYLKTNKKNTFFTKITKLKSKIYIKYDKNISEEIITLFKDELTDRQNNKCLTNFSLLLANIAIKILNDDKIYDYDINKMIMYFYEHSNIKIKFNEILKTKFNYTTLKDKLRNILYNNKSSLLACPYCNANYISAIPENNKFFFELDHFYDKGTYPYLALSFYNLIPSCRTCNSTAVKGSKNFFETPHLHPYTHDFDSIARFSLPLTKENLQQFLVPNSSIKVEDTDTEAQKEAKKLKIKIKSAKKASKADFERAENNVKDFLLEERYELHQDYINEILIKAYAYPDDYLESIQKTFPKLFEGAGSTEQMKRLIWGNYTQPKDINRRPLAKLTQDIMDELGLNK
jgi:hypothetical protein